MSNLWAPSARRVPIWRVLSATENDVRPMIPSDVTKSSRKMTAVRTRRTSFCPVWNWSLISGSGADRHVAAAVRGDERLLDRRLDGVESSRLRSHQKGRPAQIGRRAAREEGGVFVDRPAVRVVEPVDDADDVVLVAVGVLEPLAERGAGTERELRERLADARRPARSSPSACRRRRADAPSRGELRSSRTRPPPLPAERPA